MVNRKKFLGYFGEITRSTAKLSYCVKQKVGAIIVKDNRVIATGYNGVPSGVDNSSGEYYLSDTKEIKTSKTVIHAEMNAIMQCAINGTPVKGASLVCTHSPCLSCSAAIIQCGIEEVFFSEQHSDGAGIKFLKEHGVSVTKAEF